MLLKKHNNYTALSCDNSECLCNAAEEIWVIESTYLLLNESDWDDYFNSKQSTSNKNVIIHVIQKEWIKDFKIKLK